MVNKEFEIWMRQQYGDRYDLTKDDFGCYCREVVKRMGVRKPASTGALNDNNGPIGATGEIDEQNNE